MKTKNLIFATVALTTFSLQLLTFNLFASTSVPAGNVSGTWTAAGSPYLIQGSIQIADGTTLTIQAGVTVNFQGTYKLNVQGRLLAIGTAADTIIFTAANNGNGWRGIRFNNTPSSNDTSKIAYSKLQYGKATGGGNDDNGGAFYFNNFSKTIISNCRISDCLANVGGGAIYCFGSNPIITNNYISNNSTVFLSGGGGGIYCYSNSNPIITNNTISNNIASQSGGGINFNNSSPTISNNNITSNTATTGGGIICGIGSPTINNNSISNNTATYGGGIFCSMNSYSNISHNNVSNNTASNSGLGGGIYFDNGSSPFFDNNIISNNTASKGGGIICYGSNLNISNNSVLNNSSAKGGALYCTNASSPILYNTILWGNTASTSGAQVFLEDDPSDPNFYYSDVQGGSIAIDTNGNFFTGVYQNDINNNPLFISPSSGSGTGFNGVIADWSLQSNSPCINTGDPSGNYPATDKAGNQRVTVCRIDMGAYEYQNGIPLTATVSQNLQIICYGDNTATATVAPVGGAQTDSYTYSWSPGGQTTAIATSLGAITYTVTVTETSYGCSITKTITISQPTQIAFTTTSVDILCNNDNTGSITVSASGGTGTLTYSKDNGSTYQSSNIFTGLIAGSYPIVVKDANNCVTTAQSVIITQPISLPSFTKTSNDILCKNDNTGSITVSASGGSGTFTYSKDNGGTYQSSNIFNGLIAGTYPIVVKDANNCVTASQSVIITQPLSLPSFTKTSIDILCKNGNTGSITVSASGGTGTLTYSKDNGSTYQSSNIFTGLIAGTYPIVVKDANNCVTAAQSIIITEPSSLPSFTKTSIDILCNNDNTGSITVSASGGTGTLTYSKDNGSTYQSSNILTSLIAGTYPIVVKDANNCVTTAQSVIITQPISLPSFTKTSNDILCKNDNTGSITVSASGGSGTFTYSKDNGSTYQSSNIFNGLIAGTYPIVVKDANNCVTAAQSVIITEPSSLPSFTKTSIDILCKNDNTGSITVSASGGSGTLNYSKDNGSTYQSSNIFTGLIAGTYPIVVKDANNCVTAAQSVIITEPSSLPSFTKTSIDILCKNDNTGSISVSASGGTGTLTYSKDNGSTYQSSNIFTGLIAGTYPIVVKDANNCVTAAQSVIITEPSSLPSFTKTSIDILCKNDNTGSITVSASGGTSTLQYSKDNGSTYQSSNIFTGLVAGTYPIVVKDANNCVTASQSVIITQPISLPLFTKTSIDNLCKNDNTGSITVSASGGTGTLTYSKDNGSTYQSSNIFTGLIAGSYPIVVKDANNCVTATQSVIITEPISLPSFTKTSIDILCKNDNTGSITVSASGGTSTLQYSKDNGSTYQLSNIFTGLIAGTYPIVVKDANNCVTTAQSVIISEPSLDLSFTTTPSDVLCLNGNSGSITVNVNGGTPTFQYSNDSGSTFQSSNLFNGLFANTYQIVVKDANACIAASQSIIISGPLTLVSFTTSDTNVSCYQGDNGSIVITATGGTGLLQYSKDNGINFQTSNIFSTLISGTYSVIVKDANNCLTSAQTDIILQPNGLPSATFTTQNESSSLYCDGSIIASLTGGTGTIQAQWLDFSQTVLSSTDSVEALCAGTYTLNLIDSNSCTNTYTQVIQAGPIPSTPSICLVTVDSTFTHNLIVWEKTNLNMIGIDSFIVFREISTNTYQAIGAVFSDSLSKFDDYDANPATTGYRYKLKSKNNHDVSSLLSDYHNTIYLTNTGGNFSWTPYQVENITTPVSNYNVYRDDISNGIFQLIGNTTGNQFGYTDLNFSSYPFSSYYVEAEMASGACNPTRSSITAARSNIKHFGTTEIQQLDNQTTIYIFPNPASNILTITGITGKTNLRLFDVVGKLIFEKYVENNTTINTSQLEEGIYMIIAEGKSGRTINKVVIRR